MVTIEKLSPVPRYTTLRVTENADASVHWCHMHADLARAPGRACFKPALVNEILQYQWSLADRLRRERSNGDDPLRHVVLASDCDAFNLGGDLEYFCDAIRRQDSGATTVGDDGDALPGQTLTGAEHMGSGEELVEGIHLDRSCPLHGGREDVR